MVYICAIMLLFFCPIDNNGILVGVSHRPVFVAVDMEIGVIVRPPALGYAVTTLHVDKVEKLLVAKRTFVPDNILVWTLRHRLRESPCAAGNHLPQTLIIGFHLHFRLVDFWGSSLCCF